MRISDTLSYYYEQSKVAATYVSQTVTAKVSSIRREDITDGMSKVSSAVQSAFQTVYSWVAATKPPPNENLSDDWEIIGGSSKPRQAKKRD